MLDVLYKQNYMESELVYSKVSVGIRSHNSDKDPAIKSFQFNRSSNIGTLINEIKLLTLSVLSYTAVKMTDLP